jgi:hypothetical protein
MMNGRWMLWTVIAAIAVTLCLILVSQLSPSARLRRRRRKSHNRLVSNADRPMVRFSVRTPKED